MAEGEPPYMDFAPLKALFLITTQGIPDLLEPERFSAEYRFLPSVISVKSHRNFSEISSKYVFKWLQRIDPVQWSCFRYGLKWNEWSDNGVLQHPWLSRYSSPEEIAKLADAARKAKNAFGVSF
jgi:hypothetical protein